MASAFFVPLVQIGRVKVSRPDRDFRNSPAVERCDTAGIGLSMFYDVFPADLQVSLSFEPFLDQN